MARVFKREAAERDLIAQWLWYAENAGIETADRFLLAAEETLLLLADQPEAGSQTDFDARELQGVRRFPVKSGFQKILLFYFPLRDGIDLLRVVHGARDLDILFDDNPQG